PDFDCAAAITQLGVGEALVSVLEAKAVPSVVQRMLIRPPTARLGPITPDERRTILSNSPVAAAYNQTIDRDSAFEVLQRRAEEAAVPEEEEAEQAQAGGAGWTLPDFGEDRSPNDRAPTRRTRSSGDHEPQRRAPRASNRQTVAEAAVKSVVRSVGSSLGRALVRGLLGSLKRGR
ncbi:MAG TPA: helicase HerA-like domain-containing protein, partial [Tianweitania sediminis]|nr:helicase HerA-like domain-containing protein [Tianweitania sediminis]